MKPSKRTRYYKRMSNITGILSFLLMAGPITYYFIYALVYSFHTEQKLVLGFIFISAIILTVINLILKFKPRSPHQYFKAIYTKKSTTVFLTSILSTVALTDILTKYDWKLAVTYGTTIITCIIFSILKMKDVEIYWTEEYYAYAKEQQEGLQKAQEQKEYKNINNNKKTPPEASTGLSGASRRYNGILLRE